MLRDELAIEPEEVAQGVVLGVWPLLTQLGQRRAVKANVGSAHWIVRVSSPVNDVREAVAVPAKVLQQRTRGSYCDFTHASSVVGKCNVSVVADPDVCVPRIHGLHARRDRGKETIVERRERDRSSLQQRSLDAQYISQRIVRLDQLRQLTRTHLHHDASACLGTVSFGSGIE